MQLQINFAKKIMCCEFLGVRAMVTYMYITQLTPFLQVIGSLVGLNVLMTTLGF